MKKIIALLISTTSITATFAQQASPYDNRKESRPVHDQNGNNRIVYNEHAEDYSFNLKEREVDIRRIRRDFDEQVRIVKNDRRLRMREKDRRVAQLENQRDQRIEQLYARYGGGRNNRPDDRVANNARRF